MKLTRRVTLLLCLITFNLATSCNEKKPSEMTTHKEIIERFAATEIELLEDFYEVETFEQAQTHVEKVEKQTQILVDLTKKATKLPKATNAEIAEIRKILDRCGAKLEEISNTRLPKFQDDSIPEKIQKQISNLIIIKARSPSPPHADNNEAENKLMDLYGF